MSTGNSPLWHNCPHVWMSTYSTTINSLYIWDFFIVNMSINQSSSIVKFNTYNSLSHFSSKIIYSKVSKESKGKYNVSPAADSVPGVSSYKLGRRPCWYHYQVVLFSPILDVLLLICSTCHFTTSKMALLSTGLPFYSLFWWFYVLSMGIYE